MEFHIALQSFLKNKIFVIFVIDRQSMLYEALVLYFRNVTITSRDLMYTEKKVYLL